jgi:hypothetical protein
MGQILTDFYPFNSLYWERGAGETAVSASSVQTVSLHNRPNCSAAVFIVLLWYNQLYEI